MSCSVISSTRCRGWLNDPSQNPLDELALEYIGVCGTQLLVNYIISRTEISRLEFANMFYRNPFSSHLHESLRCEYWTSDSLFHAAGARHCQIKTTNHTRMKPKNLHNGHSALMASPRFKSLPQAISFIQNVSPERPRFFAETLH